MTFILQFGAARSVHGIHLVRLKGRLWDGLCLPKQCGMQVGACPVQVWFVGSLCLPSVVTTRCEVMCVDVASCVNSVISVILNVFMQLQMKNEEWGGEFVDVQPGEEVPDRSIIKTSVECTEPTVGLHGLVYDLIIIFAK